VALLDPYVDDAAPACPDPSIVALSELVQSLALRPVADDGVQARVDAEALLAVQQQLRFLTLRHVGEVASRGLHEEAGFRTARSWLRQQHPDADLRDVTLAERLREFPEVRTAISHRRLTLRAAGPVLSVLRRCRPRLDAPDGLIDGQPGHAVLEAVLRHVAELLCVDVGGLHQDDPRLSQILERLGHELAQQRSASQAESLEAALTWLGEEMSASGLPSALDRILLAVLPSELDERDKRGQERRSLRLFPLPDGTGWRLEGDLTLEAGEMFWTAMRGAAVTDPENPSDTAAWAAARDMAEDSGTSVPLDLQEPALQPRTRGHRMHDAFALVLRRYLDAGLGGLSGKAPVQVNVTVHEDFLSGQVGALPPVADSGALIPRRLLRRWWSDCGVTAFVLGLGGKALRVVHGQRTLTAVERGALSIEGGGRCLVEGCCPPRPDPLRPLIPHHAFGFAENQITGIEEAVPLCEASHFVVHVRKMTVRLRDGRWMNESGFVDGPAPPEPPF
jgi:hypothetical protein